MERLWQVERVISVGSTSLSVRRYARKPQISGGLGTFCDDRWDQSDMLSLNALGGRWARRIARRLYLSQHSGQQMFKRLFDIIASLSAFILLCPVIAVVAWNVRKKLGSPILFRQVRPGLAGKPFTMVKFRTMRDALDAEGQPLADSERITAFGSFLRASSLDELPGLWNVLKGDMSLVGPRPLLMEYLPLYSREQNRRHEVRPGVTGLAQVNGRNALSWDEKFQFDVWYVDNRSFWLDFKIIFMTIRKVFIKEGISEEGEVTMTKFTGDKR
jgi:lipopolysaccharide/colanic/teichoic acid biosynthesis glycosyltransferase